MEWLKCYDTLHNNTIDLESIQTIFKSIEIPLTKLDIVTIFNHIYSNTNKNVKPSSTARISISDFIKYLKN